MSYIMRKHAFCLCENKGADQLHGFHYINNTKVLGSTITLLPKSHISSLQPSSAVVQPVCVGPG